MLLALLTAIAAAATYTVPTDGPLAVVVETAPPGSTIEILTASWAGAVLPLGIDKDLTIVGVGGRPLLPTIVVSDANVTFREVDFAGRDLIDLSPVSLGISGGTVTIEGATFSATDAFGLVASGATIAATDLTGADHSQHRVLFAAASQVQIAESTFAGNARGALEVAGSLLTLDGVDFSGNTAEMGADVFASGASSVLIHGGTSLGGRATSRGGSLALVNSEATVQDFTIQNSSAGLAGGAVYAAEDLGAGTPLALAVAFDRLYIQGSNAPRGGAFDAVGRVGLYVRDALIHNAWSDDTNAASQGGAIAVNGGWLGLQDAVLRSFYASEGGAVHLQDAGGLLLRVEIDGTASSTGGFGAQRAGALAAIRSRLSIRDLWVHDVQVVDDIAGVWLDQSAARLESSRFEDLGSPGVGAIRIVGGELDVQDTAIARVQAQSAAALDAVGTTVRLEDVGFEDLDATSGAGAIQVVDPVWFELVRGRMCGATGSDLGLVSVRGTLGHARIAASTFVANHPGAGGVVARDGSLAEPGGLKLDHLTLVDNGAGPAVRGSGLVELTHSLVVGHGVAVSGPGFVGQDNLYFDNDQLAADAAAAPAATDRVEDPRFVDRSGDCGANLALQSDSPAFGPPSLGATGGPDSGGIDRDADGWPEGQDCDDTDPTVFPGAPDLEVDGVDNDCDGDDGDGDNDGVPVTEDCDDTDPDVFPGNVDSPNDDRDQDCSGQDAVSRIGGRSCSHAVGSVERTGALLLAFLFVRRRR